MKIFVIGGNGYAGSAFVAEAAGRGDEVVSISRNVPAEQVSGVEYVAADVTETTPDFSGADVVVATLSPRGATQGKVGETYRRLGEAAKAAGARYVMLGGFGSLRPAEGAARFMEEDSFPADYRAEAEEMTAVLDSFLAEGESAGDWLFVSPAGAFGSYNPGEARGTYRVSGSVALFDENGQSDISALDLALAMRDEIENPTRTAAQIHFAY